MSVENAVSGRRIAPRRGQVRHESRLGIVVLTIALLTTMVLMAASWTLLLSWVVVCGYAIRYGQGRGQPLVLMLWIGFSFFYPTSSIDATALQQHSVVKAWIMMAGFLVCQPRQRMRESKLLKWILAGWWGWGAAAYLPVLFSWFMVNILRTPVPPSMQGLWFHTTVLKSAAPMLLAVAVPFMFAAALRTNQERDRFITAIFWGAGLLLVLSLADRMLGFHIISTDYPADPSRLGGFSDPDPNGYGRQLLPPLFLSLSAVLVRKTRGWLLVGASLILILTTSSILLTFSRTTYASSAVGLAFVFLFNARRGRFMVLLVAIAGGLAIAATLSSVSEAFSPDAERRSTANFDSRLVLYEAVGQIVTDNPLFGAHPGGYMEALEAVGYRGSRFRVDLDDPVLISAHNMVLDVAVQYGIPMALILLASLVGAITIGLRTLRRMKKLPREVREDPALDSARIMAQVSVALSIAYLIHGLTEVVPPDLAFVALGLSLGARFALAAPAPVRRGGPYLGSSRFVRLQT